MKEAVNYSKRFITYLTLIATLAWSLGISMLIPNTAQAAVIATGIFDMTPPGGFNLPASSFENPIARFTLTQSASETLSSVTVTLTNQTSGGTSNADLGNHIDTLEVYADTNGNNFYDPGVDLQAGSQATVNVGATTAITTSANNSLASTGSLPTSFFITLKTASTWTTPDAVKLTVATNGIATSANSPTLSAAFTGNTIDANLGGGGGGFQVEEVAFINSTTVDVLFSGDLDKNSGNATSTANYTLATVNGGDNSAISQVILLPDNRSVRVESFGAVIASTGTDSITVSSTIRNNLGVANAFTGATPIFDSFQPLVISEIQVGTATDQYDEFIEIYNRSGSAVSTSSLYLHLVNSGGTIDQNVSLTFGNNVSVPSNGYLLIAPIGSTASTTADASYATSTLYSLVPDGAAYISFSSATSTSVLDKVCWGSHTPTSNCEGTAAAAITNNGQSAERKANNSSTAATMLAADASNGNGNDTDNNNFDFVARTTPQTQNSSASTEAPGGGSFGGANNGAPTIDHVPVFNASTSSTLNIIARMTDDGGELSASKTQLIYCVTSATCTPASSTPIFGSHLGSGWFKFSTTNTAWANFNTKFVYYLQAQDQASPAKTKVFTADPSFDAAFDTTSNGIQSPANQQSKALTITLAQGNVGSASISGTVNDSSGVAISGATVWIEGTQFSATTGNDGSYSFSNVGPSGGRQLLVAKTDYIDQTMSIFLPSNGLVTLPTITMFSGTVGSGGDFSMPQVVDSFPPNNSATFPTQDPDGTTPSITVNFSKTMDTTTIADTDASDSTSNIYLTEVGSNTKLGGVVTAPTNTSAKFKPSANLTAGKGYTLIITPGVRDSAGNGVQGNGSQGTYVLMFATADQFISDPSLIGAGGGDSFGSGSSFPPFVEGGMPTPGSQNVSLNNKIFVKFSEAMQDTVANKGKVALYRVANPFTGSETKTAITTTNSFNTSATILTLAPSSNLTASAHYRVEVLGGIASSKGIPLGNPGASGSSSAVFYQIDFDAGTTSDSTAPTVRGTIPADAATGVSTVRPIVISFNEAMDPATITSSNVALKSGSTAVDGEMEYDPNTWKARFAPTYSLSATSTYTVSVTTGVQDLAGNAMAAAVLQTFTTGSADTSPPTVISAQGNDFALEVTFSKPMLAVPSTDTVNYTSSVLNPSNYVVKKVNDSGVSQEAISLPSTATVTYNAIDRSVVIQGFSLTTGLTSGFTAGTTLINVKVNNATDIGLNALAVGSSSATSTAEASSGGGGFGSDFFQDENGSIVQGGNFGPAPDSLASFTSGGIGFIPNVKVRPFNSQAGVATVYSIELPISKQIEATGFIEIEFPEGVDVSGAKKDANSPANDDLNGPGTGTVVFGTSEGTLPSGWLTGGTASDGVIVNTSSRTVRVILGAVATRSESVGGNTDTHDFLHFDIDGITNSTLSDTGGGSGSSTTVTTKKSDGTVLESQTSGAFFTTAAGTMTVRGRVLAGGSGINGVTVYLDGMTGSQSTTTAANRYGGTAGEFLFQSVNTGFAMLGTERFVRVSNTDYTGSNPEPININTTDCASNTCTRNLTITDASTGAPVTFSISGTFSNDDVDFFAGGPNAFRMATGTLNGALSANTDNSIKLNANGRWFVGFGPALKGNVFDAGGPATAPAWIVPPPQEVIVTNCSSACVATPNVLNFSATAADKTVKFTVKDQDSATLGQAFVYAYSLTNNLGNGGEANADGTGSLNLSNGTYKIGASIEGMPGGNERTIELRTVSSNDTVFIDGSSTGILLSAMTVADLVLTVSKPAYTISGKVTDGTNPISDAAIDAFRTDGPGFSHARTDSSGEYTLYVDNGTWKVNAFTSQEFGRLPSKTITISDGNASNQNFEPNTTALNYGTFTVSVGVDADSNDTFVASEAEQNVQVIVSGTSDAGEEYFNLVMTDSNGSSTMKVPPGTYTVNGFSPTLGELPAFSSGLVVNSAGTVTTEPDDLLIPKSGTVTVNIVDSEGNATTTDSMAIEMQLIGAKTDNAVAFSSVSTTSFTMPISDVGTDQVAINNSTSTNPSNFYLLKLTSPGITTGDISLYGGANTHMATSTVADGLFKVEVDGDETITIALPEINYMSGTVTDADGSAVANATVKLENASTGEVITATADSSGVYSAKVSDATYTVQASKDGYIDTATSVTVSASGTLAAALTKMTVTDRTITGNITANSTSSVGATVRAEKLGGGVVTATTDASGDYTLNLTNGDWKISTAVDGFEEKSYTDVVSVSGSNVSSINITPTETKSNLADSTSQTVTPQSGGSLTDDDADLKVKAPGSALAISSSDFSLSNSETSNVVSAGGGVPVSGEAKSITSYDNSGNLVTTLKDEIAVSADYTTTELAQTAGTLTIAKIEEIKMSSWDTANDNWENLPTTVAYKDSNGNFVEPSSDLSNVSSVSYTGQTSHLSVFNPTVSSDGLAPSAPTSLAVNPSTDSVIVSWTAPTTNSDDTSLTDLLGYEVYRSTSEGGTYTQVNTADITGTSYTDDSVTRDTSYYYKVTAADTGGVESGYSSVSAEATPSASQTNQVQVGGGGGGGGAPTPAATPSTDTDTSTDSSTEDDSGTTAEDSSTIESTTTEQTSATPEASTTEESSTAASAPAPSATFTSDLTIGASSDEVRELQLLLKDLGFFTFPTATGYYGPVTQEAVKKFQAANGIATVGVVGPATRAALNRGGSLSAPAAPAAPASTSVRGFEFATFLGEGSKGDTVRKLQQLLKDLGHFTYPTITGYFGPVTAAAVKEFQAANGVASVGFVGPATRAALNGKTGGKAAPAPKVEAPAPPPTGPIGTFTRFMGVGTVGDQVRDLQKLLRSLGHFNHPSNTGYFGPVTSAAVKKFQADNGIDQVGFVGPQTRAALNSTK